MDESRKEAKVKRALALRHRSSEEEQRTFNARVGISKFPGGT